MSDAVSLLTMRTEVRRRANQETSDQANALITDAEINSLLNYFLKRVYNKLASASEQNYYRSQTTLVTSANQSLYPLLVQFMRLISVSFQLGPSDKIPIYPYLESERHLYDYLGWWDRINPVSYQLQGSNINFIPLPQGNYNILINFIPTYTPLVLDADTFDGISGFEEAAIWEAVAACNNKDETDPGYAVAQAARMWDEINAYGRQRDMNAPVRTQRVRKVRRYGWFR